MFSIRPSTEKPSEQRFEQRPGDPIFLAEIERFSDRVAKTGVSATFAGVIRLFHGFNLTATTVTELFSAPTDLWIQRQLFQSIVLERIRFRRVDNLLDRRVTLTVN
jgi:hypothetical protein